MKPSLENILLTVSKSHVIDEGNIAQAERLIIESLIQGLDIPRAGIWLSNANKSAIECKLLVDTFHQTEIENLSLKRVDYPHYFSQLDNERAIIANDAQTDSVTKEFVQVYLKPNDIRAMLDIPIRHKGKMIGIICLEQIGNIKQWSQDEVTFSAAISDLYGRAISAFERNQYQYQLEQQNQNLEAQVKQRTQALENSLEHLQQAQDKLIESEKMASLGNLVAGVAHEVNTPIGIAITGITHSIESIKELETLLTSNKLSKPKFEQSLAHIKTANELIYNNLTRAVDLIQNFKQTAADQSGYEKYTFNLAHYIDNTLSSLKPLLKSYKVILSTDLKPDIELYSVPGCIAQIITILVQNACYHAYPTNQSERRFIFKLYKQDEMIILSGKDNGKGIAKEVLNRVFEPFYTTSRKDGGTGLGLSILYNLVVKQLNGEVQLITEPHQGCEFILTFPQQKKG